MAIGCTSCLHHAQRVQDSYAGAGSRILNVPDSNLLDLAKKRQSRQKHRIFGGTQHKECTVCHYVTAVGFIPAKGGDIEPSDPSGWTPNPNLPATGDDNTSFIWIALLIICASTAAGTVIYGRRKKQR